MTNNNTNNSSSNTPSQPPSTPPPFSPFPTPPFPTPPTTSPTLTAASSSTPPASVPSPSSASTSAVFKEKLGTMTIWLTSECNLKCKYCFVYKLNENQPPGRMSFETADQLIQFAKQHLKPEGTFWFFGAEPFCNYDVMKYIVEKCVAEGHKWKFGATTNATLLTKDIVVWMKKHNFSVLCSIDGPKECHDENRVYHDGKGSWNDAWQGLVNVKEILVLQL